MAIEDATRKTGWEVTEKGTVDANGNKIDNVTFTGIAAPSENQRAKNDTDFGFRVTLGGNIVNETGVSWRLFEEKTQDKQVILTDAQKKEIRDLGYSDTLTSHPFTAHFHDDTAQKDRSSYKTVAAGEMLKVTGGEFTQKDATTKKLNTAAFTILAVKNLVKKDDTLASNGIGLHEFEVKTVQRNFQLILTPTAIPEPAAWVLLGLGLIGMVILLRRGIAGPSA